MAELSVLEDVARAQGRGLARGIPSVCSAHPVVLQAAFEQALEDGGAVLVESTSNQVNQEGGYTGVRPAEFAAFVHGLATEAGLPTDRLVLGGDHLGPHPWRAQGAALALPRAAEMVRQYVRAGYAKIHLDASMACADDPLGPLADTVAAARTADLAAAAEAALAERPPGAPPPVYVVGTEVPPPGGQQGEHEGPSVTRVEDAEGTLDLVHEAFERRGLERGWDRVIALVVQPGVEFGDEAVFPYRPGATAGLKALAEARALLFEAHSTDYQDESALRALVADRFAILKVGPELTFAFREAVFALEAMERELLETRARVPLSGVGRALEEAMRRDPRHWRPYYHPGDEETARLQRRFSLSDRCRYYWTGPEVLEALRRLFANLEGRRLPRGLVAQYLPDGVAAAEDARPGLPGRLVRGHVRRVLGRYARACREATAGVPAGAEQP
ncbi:MAG TPA: class II D-tagatose-bisphosphate aldolase, non-catalytic subunit [Vicinamibacteria bacterium]|nr:class II D-tagatose-bisphosphate aldolase, non-catalytic subunit [Vicinamibacteria bacterium]